MEAMSFCTYLLILHRLAFTMKRAFLPILFLALLLLFSTSSGRELIGHQNENGAVDVERQLCHNSPCQTMYCCGTRCCSAEEYVEFLKTGSIPTN